MNHDNKLINRSRATITAVMPIYDGATFVVDAVKSILSQTQPPDEVILVDDGSTDGSLQIIDNAFPCHKFIVVRQPNSGQSAARNAGVARATGDLIAFLDQDDIWYPAHLEVLSRPFTTENPTLLGWVYSDLDEIDRDGQVTVRSLLAMLKGSHPKRDVFSCLQENMFVLPSASLISRRAFTSVGGFDEELSGYEDDDLFLRLFRAGFNNVFIDVALSKWRVYTGSYSYSYRMARSRMTYLRKLVAAFPDNQKLGRHYIRDLLFPRFYPEIVKECREAIASRDEVAISASRSNLNYITNLVPSPPPASLQKANLLISAIIPLYNGAPYIESAIRSVYAQTVPVAELIVIDDGSMDSGPEVVRRLAKELPVRLLRKDNGGQASARNFGVRNCAGDYIALLDQDDIWYPDHIEKLAEPFTKPASRKLGWVYSNLDEMDENGRTIVTSFLSSMGTQHPKRDIFACLREDLFILPSASLIRREAFEAVGGFDEALAGYEDDDLFLRLFEAGYDNEYVNEPLSRWRIYPSSSSYSPRMARSRATYARKLLAAYPDDPSRARFYTRDLLVPRFFPHMFNEYVKAVAAGDKALIQTTREELLMLGPWLSGRSKALAVAITLPMFSIGALHDMLGKAIRMRYPRFRKVSRA